MATKKATTKAKAATKVKAAAKPKTKVAVKPKTKAAAKPKAATRAKPKARAKAKQHHHAMGLSKIVDEKVAAKLSEAGVIRVGQVRNMSNADLKKLPGIGAKAVEALRAQIPAKAA
jgi:predicted flap endonuclease-1-like 5' DNA nuclease